MMLPNVSHCIDNNDVHYNPYVQYEIIDLGLPSGNLWSSCNIGAKHPWESGLYFAWGETEGYTTKQIVGSDLPHKDFSQSDYTGPTTQVSILPSNLDAATVNMGQEWAMPITNDLIELFNNVIVTPIVIFNVNAMRLTSKNNGKSIILPISGGYADGEKTNEDYMALYTSQATWMNGSFNTPTVIGINKDASGEISIGHGETWNPMSYKGYNIRGIIKNEQP